MEISWNRILCIVATTIAFVAVISALLVGWGGPTPYCTKDAAQVSACASWVQAIFSVAAIVTAVAVPFAQHRIQAVRDRLDAEARTVGTAMKVIPHLRHHLTELNNLAAEVLEAKLHSANAIVDEAGYWSAASFHRVDPGSTIFELAADSAPLGADGRRLQFLVMSLKTIAQQINEGMGLLHSDRDEGAASSMIGKCIDDAIALRKEMASVLGAMEVAAMRAPESRTIHVKRVG